MDPVLYKHSLVTHLCSCLDTEYFIECFMRYVKRWQELRCTVICSNATHAGAETRIKYNSVLLTDKDLNFLILRGHHAFTNI